jgi:hypothetical protein
VEKNIGFFPSNRDIGGGSFSDGIRGCCDVLVFLIFGEVLIGICLDVLDFSSVYIPVNEIS